MKFYLVIALIFTLVFSQVDGGLFDRQSGKKISQAKEKEYRVKNLLKNCTLDVKSCTPHEGSRVDGTCNNYKYPTKGSARGPYLRLLKLDYRNNTVINKTKKGKPLPSARKVRTTIQTTGRVEDKTVFNMAAPHFFEFIHRDVSFLNGSLDFIRYDHDCCQSKGVTSPRCSPLQVPDDDPYLKVTDIRCLNFSQAETFQDVGCSLEATTPEQINYQTPVIDLSTVYGVDEEDGLLVRQGEGGLLKMEQRNGRQVPLVNGNSCFRQKTNESVCYKFGFPEAGNYDLRTTVMTILFMREHNRLAKILYEINPCWKDDRLFKVARQINIATAAHIFMYELLPSLLGSRHMFKYGLVSENVDYISGYEEDAEPLVYAEYEVAVRFFHTFLDGRIKKYDKDYHYNGELSLSDTLFRQDLLENGTLMEDITRGMFYQHAGKIDDIQDPEISESFFNQFLRVHDLSATDIQKGRDFGVGNYNEYRKICGLKPAKTFEDFLDVMESEKVEILRKLYEDVEDLELLPGIMTENFIEGSFVGPTLFCIMVKQLQKFRFDDRFWFERGDQYHSLTLGQLNEIRKTSMARLACDNADGIKNIQPQAFLNVGSRNMPIPCSHILGLDLTKWRDRNCHIEYEQKEKPRRGIGMNSYLDASFDTFWH